MSLEEEIDMLRVQASQDAATLHELKVALEQERESTRHCNNRYHVHVDRVVYTEISLVLVLFKKILKWFGWVFIFILETTDIIHFVQYAFTIINETNDTY